MKKFKKISVVLSFVLCISIVFCGNVFAQNTNNQTKNYGSYQTEIIGLLTTIKESPDTYGMENVDFNNLYLGSKITPYKIENNSIQILKSDYYPILCNEKVVCIATVSYINGSISVQIGRDFSSELQNFINNNENNIALVYSENELLIKTPNSDYNVLYSYQQDSTPQEQLNSTPQEQLNYLKITPKEKLNLIEKVTTSKAMLSGSAPMQKILDCKYVPTYGAPTCWATCISSIGQYRKGIKKTAKNITDYLGVTGVDNAGSPENVEKALYGIYKLNSNHVQSPLNYDNVVNNIQMDEPIYTVWESFDGTLVHAVVVCGYTGLPMYGACNFTYVDNNYKEKRIGTVTNGELFIDVLGVIHKSTYYKEILRN